jgi:hypothetical protein
MEYSMPAYRIKHVLPDGTVAGYHADGFCNITLIPANAKLALTNLREASAWLLTTRRNFEYVWKSELGEDGGDSDYRALTIWQGCTLDQIKTVLEEF